MDLTATRISIRSAIDIFYQTVLKSQPENVSGVPYLALTFVQTFNGEMMVQTRREFVLTFVNCSPTILKEYIEDQELLTSGLGPDEVDCVGDEICHKICLLVFRYAGVEGMERLQVDVVFEINWDPSILEEEVMYLPYEEEEEEEEEDRWRRISIRRRRMSNFLMTRRRLMHPSDEEEEHSRRMRFVHKFIYGDATGGSPAAGMGGGEEEVCGICIEAMKLGEMLIRTPCVHHFHACCILPWFKRSSFCPLCRCKIDDR